MGTSSTPRYPPQPEIRKNPIASPSPTRYLCSHDRNRPDRLDGSEHNPVHSRKGNDMERLDKTPPEAQHPRAAPEHDRHPSQAATLIDNRPRAAAQRKLVEAIHQSPRVLAQRKAIQSIKQSPRVAAQLARQPTAAPNHTGLSDKLKAGVETLSGMSLDHVRVHYNSSRPAQLQALAYTHGSDIHVAPGQETHVPHEAWHVVQQAQGRVQPTLQMKNGVAVNDDAGLEHEADVMGTKALNAAVQPVSHLTTPGPAAISRVPGLQQKWHANTSPTPAGVFQLTRDQAMKVVKSLSDLDSLPEFALDRARDPLTRLKVLLINNHGVSEEDIYYVKIQFSWFPGLHIHRYGEELKKDITQDPLFIQHVLNSGVPSYSYRSGPEGTFETIGGRTFRHLRQTGGITEIEEVPRKKADSALLPADAGRQEIEAEEDYPEAPANVLEDGPRTPESLLAALTQGKDIKAYVGNYKTGAAKQGKSEKRKRATEEQEDETPIVSAYLKALKQLIDETNKANGPAAKPWATLTFWPDSHVKTEPARKIIDYDGAKHTIIKFLAKQLHAKGGAEGLVDVFGGTGMVSLETHYPLHQLSDYAPQTLNFHLTNQSNPFKTDAIALGAIGAKKEATQGTGWNPYALNSWKGIWAKSQPSSAEQLLEPLRQRLSGLAENLQKKGKLSDPVQKEYDLLKDNVGKGVEQSHALKFAEQLLPVLSGNMYGNTLKPELPDDKFRAELTAGGPGRSGQAARFLAEHGGPKKPALEELREKVVTVPFKFKFGSWQTQTGRPATEKSTEIPGNIPPGHDVYLDPPYAAFDWTQQHGQAEQLEKSGKPLEHSFPPPKPSELTGHYDEAAVKALDLPSLPVQAGELARKKHSVFFSSYARLDQIQQTLKAGARELHLFPVRHYADHYKLEFLAIWNPRAPQASRQGLRTQEEQAQRNALAKQIKEIRKIAGDYVDAVASLLASGAINRTAVEGKSDVVAGARRQLWRILRGTLRTSRSLVTEPPGAKVDDTFQRLHKHWAAALKGDASAVPPEELIQIKNRLKLRLALVEQLAALEQLSPTVLAERKQEFLKTALDKEEQKQMEQLFAASTGVTEIL